MAAGIPSRRELEAALIERHGTLAHEKISRAHVAVAGLGGLGSNIAVNLARLGVGRLRLIDFDHVDISNLNRQQYAIRHLGMLKTDAMREIIAEINPYIEVDAECVTVDEHNAERLFAREQIVCEAFDAPENKALLVGALLEKCSGCVVVAASGMAGYGSANEIATRRRGGRLYLCGDGATDIGPGTSLMAPRVSVCAGHQANMVLRLILGETNP